MQPQWGRDSRSLSPPAQSESKAWTYQMWISDECPTESLNRTSICNPAHREHSVRLRFCAFFCAFVMMLDVIYSEHTTNWHWCPYKVSPLALSGELANDLTLSLFTLSPIQAGSRRKHHSARLKQTCQSVGSFWKYLRTISELPSIQVTRLLCAQLSSAFPDLWATKRSTVALEQKSQPPTHDRSAGSCSWT